MTSDDSEVQENKCEHKTWMMCYSKATSANHRTQGHQKELQILNGENIAWMMHHFNNINFTAEDYFRITAWS